MHSFIQYNHKPYLNSSRDFGWMRGIKFKCSFVGSKTNLNYDGTSTCIRKRKKYLLDRTELILLMVQVK